MPYRRDRPPSIPGAALPSSPTVRRNTWVLALLFLHPLFGIVRLLDGALGNAASTELSSGVQFVLPWVELAYLVELVAMALVFRAMRPYPLRAAPQAPRSLTPSHSGMTMRWIPPAVGLRELLLAALVSASGLSVWAAASAILTPDSYGTMFHHLPAWNYVLLTALGHGSIQGGLMLVAAMLGHARTRPLEVSLEGRLLRVDGRSHVVTGEGTATLDGTRLTLHEPDGRHLDVAGPEAELRWLQELLEAIPPLDGEQDVPDALRAVQQRLRTSERP